jgi:hypothetical protein
MISGRLLPGRFLPQLPPTEFRFVSIRPFLNHIRNQFPQHWPKLEAKPTAPRRHHQPWPFRMMVNPQMFIQRVTI